jgi:patatin-related protein
MIDQQVPQPHSGDVKELRLALVCYGGVSLAIYMHGITKEIHKLVRASEAFATATSRTSADNPFPQKTTEHVYWETLAVATDAEEGLRTRVVVDVIAGTSAGGINGICLGKALAGDRSQEALKTLWIEKGDIGLLMRGCRKLPWKWRLPFLLIPPRRPLLRGNEMCQWLYDAFEQMDAGAKPGSLIPPDRTLELFVPITDFHGYERHFPIEDPPFIRDRTHRHIMAFRHDGNNLAQFAREYNHALAFAARATSSFPAAFPPITFRGYQAAVKAAGPALGGRAEEFFSLYSLADVEADQAYFVDGGVLNNYPFGPAIDAIQRKPAASEVNRRLVYVEPDPSFSDGPVPSTRAPSGPPTLIKTALGAFASIPGNQPIIDELTRLAERNRVVQRVRDVIQTSFQPVERRVDELLRLRNVRLADILTTSSDNTAELAQVIEEAATKDAGLNYATYIRQRLAFLTDAYAALIADALLFPPTSYQAAFVANVLRSWARADHLLGPDGMPSERGRRALAALDLGYHERRLRFVIAALSWWYRSTDTYRVPDRQDLDRAKARVYQAIADLQTIVRELAAEDSTKQLLNLVFDPKTIDGAIGEGKSVEAYLEEHGKPLATLRDDLESRIERRLPTVEENLYQDLRRMATAWSDEAKRALLVRYLGFPYWDILVYPIQALTNVGERDNVEVLRISPRDTKWPKPPPGEKGKLKGVSLFHFGAFLERSYRQNDYLWGRLDATERLISLLLPKDMVKTQAAKRRLRLDATDAVLSEERQFRANLGALFQTLERQLGDARNAASSSELA